MYDECLFIFLFPSVNDFRSEILLRKQKKQKENLRVEYFFEIYSQVFGGDCLIFLVVSSIFEKNGNVYVFRDFWFCSIGSCRSSFENSTNVVITSFRTRQNVLAINELFEVVESFFFFLFLVGLIWIKRFRPSEKGWTIFDAWFAERCPR